MKASYFAAVADRRCNRMDESIINMKLSVADLMIIARILYCTLDLLVLQRHPSVCPNRPLMGFGADLRAIRANRRALIAR